MCALAHFFEQEGLATTVIVLVREHAEKMRPPRALWVPFELGRPFGSPNKVTQQSEVLEQVLALLHIDSTDPVLQDFAGAEVTMDVENSWQPPDVLGVEGVMAEMQGILPVWEQFKALRGRTTVGLSHLSPQEATAFIDRFYSDNPLENPKGMARVARARFAIDDIKAFYMEAAALTGAPTSTQLQNWFWNQTLAGQMILNFQRLARESDDKNLNLIAGSLVPAERVL
ncbi:MAG: hypothetical protein KTR18_08175 [Acidiferrobacterales bacterium]|nr:hypothetical protein [Acidiferrobacterales bacterium]